MEIEKKDVSKLYSSSMLLPESLQLTLFAELTGCKLVEGSLGWETSLQAAPLLQALQWSWSSVC